jgi:hypothetical protein
MKSLSSHGIEISKSDTTLTISCPEILRILGSSIPLTTPKGKNLSCFSIPFPKDTSVKVLLFLSKTFLGSETFLLMEHDKSSGWWASKNKIPSLPREAYVDDNGIISLKIPAGIVSTGTNGEYKVTCDSMCQFLVEDINESELLAEAVKLADEQSELEKLRQEVASMAKNLKMADDCVQNICTLKDLYGNMLCEIQHVSQEPWWSIFSCRLSRLSRIRKLVENW